MTVHLKVVIPTSTLRTRKALDLLEQAVGVDRIRSHKTEGGHTSIWLVFPNRDDFRDCQILILGAFRKENASEGVTVKTYQPNPRNTGRQTGWPWRGRPAVLPSRTTD